MDFVKNFNARTAAPDGPDHPRGRSPCTPTAATRSSPRRRRRPILLRKAAGVDKGSGEPNKKKVGKVTQAQVEEIARTKLPDLNAANLEAAIKTIEGTARSMGIEIQG